MITNWITFGMSAFTTPGFQDTSRLMTSEWSGPKIYVEPPKSFRSWLGLDGTVIKWTSEQTQETTVLRPPLPVPSRIDTLNWSTKIRAYTLDRELRAYFGDMWRDSTLVYITNWTPYLQPLVSKLKPKYLVIDFVDDVLNFPYDWNAERVTAEYKKLIDDSCLITTVSPSLQHKIRNSFGKHAIILPNGVNKKFFSAANMKPKLINDIKGKLSIGFAGTLNHWIDFEAMRNLANLYPENAFILMGKRGHFANENQEKSLEELLNLENVHYLGPIPYEELPGYLHQMDVLLLPRRSSKSSEASNPLKLYEYLAVGKPIVTSGFPIPSEIRSLIYHCQSNECLKNSMDLAIHELQSKRKKVARQQRQACAKRNTWQKRVQIILDKVENVQMEDVHETYYLA